jgi:thymidylate kinase
MVENKKCAPLFSIVGVDGSGKTTITRWLERELISHGLNTVAVWSRFQNYSSKPLLAMTRLTGHNYYRQIDGVLFGYHSFEHLAGYRELFAILQAIDVNIAAYRRIHRKRRKASAIICERGPWDTLVDVISDTGLNWMLKPRIGRLYGFFMHRQSSVLLISRSLKSILLARPELKYDPKLKKRMRLYFKLAAQNNWAVIDNNGPLEMTKDQIRKVIGLG